MTYFINSYFWDIFDKDDLRYNNIANFITAFRLFVFCNAVYFIQLKQSPTVCLDSLCSEVAIRNNVKWPLIFGLLIFHIIFDNLDGWVARKLKIDNVLGKRLDIFVDVVSCLVVVFLVFGK